MRVNLIRGIVVAGLSAAIAAAPLSHAAETTYSRLPPPSTAPPPPSHDGYGHRQRQHGLSSGEAVALGAGALLIGCAIFCNRHADKPKQRPDDADDEPDRQDLLQNGPHVSDSQPFGVYAVYGFVRNGWPMVIEYDSDPDSAVWITITVDGKPWTEGLEGGHHYVNLPYRGGSARKTTPALFVIQSAVRGTNPVQPSRLEIVGVGCGPRAVGSVAIHDLSFAPSARRPGGDFARFGFRASSPFNVVNTEILRYERGDKDGHRSINVSTVTEQKFGPQPIGVFGPQVWDGLDPRSRQPSHGPHRLQVRGWEVDGDESWVSALSTQDVLGP
jgi:hypothetical protein